MNDILNKLGAILSFVESPSRYMGGEANSVIKDPKTLTARMALVFPDIYEIGMSHNGTKVLYHCINREPDLLCEVGFAPWTDMADLMRTHGVPLYTHATWSAVRDFDVVGISLQTELNFTNVPYVLELAGITAWTKDRGEAEPIVVGGGPSVANPEPIAEFFDAFVVGDGEDLAPRLLRTVGEFRKQNKTRLEILQELSTWDGIYVPSFATLYVKTEADGVVGEIVPSKPATGSYKSTAGIKRVWVDALRKDQYPVANLVPNMGLVHDRFAIEVSRGCTQGCRFCQAGIWYRPSRELPPDEVLELAKEGLKATGERQIGLLSLSSADYGPIEKLTDAIIDDPFFDSVDVSLPSLRANSFGQSLAQKVAALKGGRSATFAPETGSERLRKAINKVLTDQEMIDAAESVFSNGFMKIKLYTMIGLPSETMEDMEAFCGLIQKLVDVGRRHNKGIMIQASVGILIPKAFTPLQWAPIMEREQVYEHLAFVRERFYKHKNVKVNWNDWNTTFLEGVYSRGDRRLAPLIYKAYQQGQVMEGHSEKINYEGWVKLWEESNYDPSWALATRSEEEVFPWDFLHVGVTKSYLLSEWRKVWNPESAPVPDCKWGECQNCGIPGNGKDTKLAPPPEKYQAPSRTPEQIVELVNSRKPKQGSAFHYEFIFEKRGLSRFLPHQNTMGVFERSLARLGIPIKFSEGFSPKPRIHNTGALPLGLESCCEVVSIELLQELPLFGPKYQEMLREISRPFPHGMAVTKIVPLEVKLSKQMPDALEYQWAGQCDKAKLEQDFANKTMAKIVNHRGHAMDLNEHVLKLVCKDCAQGVELTYLVKTNGQGNTVSPFTLLAGLLGITDDQARTMLVVKTRAVHLT
jgi:radical SAM family uncharacterized protein/radical SAM-linked protein